MSRFDRTRPEYISGDPSCHAVPCATRLVAPRSFHPPQASRFSPQSPRIHLRRPLMSCNSLRNTLGRPTHFSPAAGVPLFTAIAQNTSQATPHVMQFLAQHAWSPHALFTFHFSLFTFHFSLFTFHFSLFTFHFSLFTFHFPTYTRTLGRYSPHTFRNTPHTSPTVALAASASRIGYNRLSLPWAAASILASAVATA
jgi:hypothetical protein